jgi:hypothetical protein
MDRDSWEVDDPVSQARLDWLTPTNSSPYFAVTSILGSGSLFTRCSLPPVPYPTLSGWRFDVKRTDRGQFNLYYSIGRRNTNGAYTPERFYFHQLSGESFSKGNRTNRCARKRPHPWNYRMAHQRKLDDCNGLAPDCRLGFIYQGFQRPRQD